MNLPDSSETPSGEPAPLNIAHLSAPRLLVDVKDAQNDLSLAVPGITLDIGRAQGRVALNAPATLSIGNKQTRISTLDGGASFDGRASHVDGSLTAFRRDVTATAIGGCARCSSATLRSTACARDRGPRAACAMGDRRWRVAARNDRVRCARDRRVCQSVADLQVTSTRLNWRAAWTRPARRQQVGRSRATDVAATARVTSRCAGSAECAVHLCRWKHHRRTDEIPFGAEPAHFNASWRDVDATALTTALAGPVEVRSGRCAVGRAERHGAASRSCRNGLRTSCFAPMAASLRRGRLAIPGRRACSWRTADGASSPHHRAGNTVPIALVAGGAA